MTLRSYLQVLIAGVRYGWSLKTLRFEFELQRLARLPRRRPGKTRILGPLLEYVDAATTRNDLEEVYRRRVYEFAPSKTGGMILDCGANIGLASIFLGTLAPAAQLVAVEADPAIHEVLERNLRSFGLERASAVHAAVAARAGKVSFRQEGSHSGRIPLGGEPGDLSVPAVRLRDLVDGEVDLLKLDVEGAELSILEESEDVLESVQRVFVEYHSHVAEPQTLDRLLALLTRKGFRYHIRPAFCLDRPFVARRLLLGMDLQLNVYGWRIGTAEGM